MGKQHGHRVLDCNTHAPRQMNTNTAGYNGWRNHATWAIGLHLMDYVTETIIEDRAEWENDPDGTNIWAASQMFKEALDEQIEMADLSPGGLLLDLLDTSDIDWHALGQHALDAALS